ncbi:MAG: hypothetical protein CMB67_01900 [Euryarchaeota archaeon]|nr:hypothetical protein [Euryarchaeota archaeon]
MNALSEKIGVFVPQEDNIYDVSEIGVFMKRGVFIGFLFTAMVSFCSISPTVSAQVTPEVDLECQDPPAIEVHSGSSRTAIVECTLTNPTAFVESVELTYQAGVLASAGPGSVTVPADSETDFQLSLRAEEGEEVGEYQVNITALVTQWNGIPVSFLGSSDEEEKIVEILPFTVCSLNGPGPMNVDAGQDLVFSTTYECESNEENVLEITLHLLEEGSTEEKMWPSGFNDMSDGECKVENPMGSVVCEFILTTPPNLESKWEGCLIVVDESTDPAWSCSSSFAFPLTVNEKDTLVPSVGLGVNGSILEEFGSSEDGPLLVAGAFSFVLLAAVLVFLVKRRLRKGVV